MSLINLNFYQALQFCFGATYTKRQSCLRNFLFRQLEDAVNEIYFLAFSQLYFFV
jgi:hypothetical protein